VADVILYDMLSWMHGPKVYKVTKGESYNMRTCKVCTYQLLLLKLLHRKSWDGHGM